MLRKLLLPLCAVALLLSAVGCSDNGTESQAADQVDLNDEFAGLSPTDEAPGFGDAELIASDDEEVAVDDPMALSAEVAAIETDPTSGVFRFRAVWGNLRLDTADTAPTSWDGSVEVSRGAVLIKKTIRFELAQDYIVPRVDRHLLEWVSTTTIHHDGIMADILIPALRPTYDTTVTVVVDSLGDSSRVITIDTIPPDNTPVEVTFNAGSYSRTFTLGELAALDEVVTLPDSHQIAVSAYQFTRCPKGALVGGWGMNDQGQGVFRGRWVNQFGHRIGYLRGYYGTNDAGEKVFAGKWISDNGRFEGFVAGTWTPGPNTNATDASQGRTGGTFEGKIYTANRVEIGALRGQYKAANSVRGGFFQARWKLYCPTTTDNSDDGVLNDGM